MIRDQGRDRIKSEVASRGALPPAEATSLDGDESYEVEFDDPTRPRARRDDSEAPAEPRASVSLPAHRGAQDSFQPVRVPEQSVRPPLSLWTRAWATTALIIVVAGGAIGIVAGLRLRTFGLGERSAQRDSAPSVVVHDAPERRAEAKSSPTKAAAPAAPGGFTSPAAAAGFAAPSPLAPVQVANRHVVPVTSAADTLPIPSSPVSVTARAPRAVPFRTPESLAISPVAPPTAQAISLPRRPKPTPTIAPTTAITRPPDESARVPTPAPATSAAADTKADSEAWVTEERRF